MLFNNLFNNQKKESLIKPGYRLGNNYKVIQKLGEGGFGATFLASSARCAPHAHLTTKKETVQTSVG